MYEQNYKKAVKFSYEFVADLGLSKPANKEKLLTTMTKENEENKMQGINTPKPKDYFSRKRGAGEGQIRINKQLPFRDDMYSLLFIANLHEKYKEACE